METRFNVTGTERKALVKAIENIIQETAVYKKAPTFEYTVGNFTIDKNGTVSCDDACRRSRNAGTDQPDGRGSHDEPHRQLHPEPD